MCGILFYNGDKTRELKTELLQEFSETNISNPKFNWCLTDNEQFNNIIPYIVARGPNYCSLRVDDRQRNMWFSSILSLRTPFTKQSVAIGDRFVLQYNGELYNDELIDSDGTSDTQFIANLISKYPDNMEKVVSNMYGEFAYTIFDTELQKLHFGRDKIGKRSLSYQVNLETNEIFVASCTGKDQGLFINCDANKMYTYDLNNYSLIVKDLSESYSVTNHTNEFTESNDLELQLYELLTKSVHMRTKTIHPLHKSKQHEVAVLFSGGLDCSVIAALICMNMAPGSVLELLNVGFENPRTKMSPADVPDRILGLKSYETLKENFPLIDIKFIEVDVPYDEYLVVKEKVIDLIYPKQTEMDLSIAIAFYFASRGVGFHNKQPYNRKSLVLFSGLGADELYGGYHKFANKSPEELIVELTTQINNIHDRNLNRDDKVIASNGVEVRYPFLDEKVVEFSTQQIPLGYKLNKLVLRNIADKFLSLGDIAQEPKRAIQFGAKSAKMIKGQTKGTDLI